MPIHNQIMDVVGDFTSLTLLSIDNTAGKSFLERCKNLQQQLWSDLAHPYYSGVSWNGKLAKAGNTQRGHHAYRIYKRAWNLNRVGSNEQEEYFWRNGLWPFTNTTGMD